VEASSRYPLDSTDVGFLNPSQHRSIVSLFESVRKRRANFKMLLVRKEDVADHPGTARILDPQWIDMDLLKYWVAQCCGLHTICTTAMNTMPTIPALLVDVKRKCIVSGTSVSACRYIALSYRFGRARHFKLNRVLLNRLEVGSALSSPEILRLLPLNVQHAIVLVEALGESYLWTDSLCITHQDPSTLTGQLERMAAIYSSALFTIVALDGDGTKGLLGLPGISEPRESTQRVFGFEGENLVVRQITPFDLTSRSGYHERGWTYQEFRMSPRKLIFSKGEAHWMCQCCEWHEDLARDMEINKYINSRPQLLVAGFADLESLGHLLSEYNKRNLTYDEDALPAIAGLLAVLSRTFTGGFLYGLPEMMFDTALGWDSEWAQLRERVPSQSGGIDRQIPAWSWLSWQGPFVWRNLGEAGVNTSASEAHLKVKVKETSPITEWYASSTPEGKTRRKIVPTWYQDRKQAKDPRQPMADGWCRHEATSVFGMGRGRAFPDGCSSHVYEHRNTPGKNGQYWFYPFRVPSIEPSTPFSNPAQMRYLFCKTWKATVLACDRTTMFDGGVLDLREDIGRPVIGSLITHNDQWCQRSNSEDSNRDKVLDVVAVNRFAEFSDTTNSAPNRGDLHSKKKEYVTVLWVKWEGNVAYRQACGRIEREAWEKLDLEEIDLVLG
jgi:hypothetical protein